MTPLMQCLRRTTSTLGSWIDFGSNQYTNKTHFPSEENKAIYRSAKQKMYERSMGFCFSTSLKNRAAQFPSSPSFGPFSIRPIFPFPKRELTTSSRSDTGKKGESIPKPVSPPQPNPDPVEKKPTKPPVKHDDDDIDAGYDPFPFYPEFGADLWDAVQDELCD